MYGYQLENRNYVEESLSLIYMGSPGITKTQPP